MTKLLETLSEWLGENWGWIALIGIFVDISPIKFSPITSILRWIGRKLTGELREQIAALRADVDAQQKDQIRTTVLEFSNSLIYRTKHTKEEFDHVLGLDSKYHTLLKPAERNSVYDSAIAFVRRVYDRCKDEGSFLPIPPPGKVSENGGSVSCGPSVSCSVPGWPESRGASASGADPAPSSGMDEKSDAAVRKDEEVSE